MLPNTNPATKNMLKLKKTEATGTLEKICSKSKTKLKYSAGLTTSITLCL